MKYQKPINERKMTKNRKMTTDFFLTQRKNRAHRDHRDMGECSNLSRRDYLLVEMKYHRYALSRRDFLLVESN